MPGECECHCVHVIKFEALFWRHSWFTQASWEGAESSDATKMFSQPPEYFPDNTAAQTIICAGCILVAKRWLKFEFERSLK